MTFQEFKAAVAANMDTEGYQVQEHEFSRVKEMSGVQDQFSHVKESYVWQCKSDICFEMIRYSVPAKEWMVLCVESPSAAPAILEFGSSLDEIY